MNTVIDAEQMKIGPGEFREREFKCKFDTSVNLPQQPAANTKLCIEPARSKGGCSGRSSSRTQIAFRACRSRAIDKRVDFV